MIEKKQYNDVRCLTCGLQHVLVMNEGEVIQYIYCSNCHTEMRCTRSENILYVEVRSKQDQNDEEKFNKLMNINRQDLPERVAKLAKYIIDEYPDYDIHGDVVDTVIDLLEDFTPDDQGDMYEEYDV